MNNTKSNALFLILSKLIEQEVERQLAIKLSALKSDNKSKPEDDLLNTKQVLEILGISDTTLYWHRKKRGLNCIEIGKNIYFRKSELDKWLNENKKGNRND